MERNLFFTSDMHFSHTNVIKYAKRPFKNADEMNEEMIKRWNAVVTKQDIVYIIGDVAFERDHNKLVWLLSRLNGEKHLIEGNHDDKMHASVKKCFQSISPLREIRVADADNEFGWQYITLCHYPMLSWNKAHYGSWNLFGHEHGNFAHLENNQQLDVGVDCWDYTPASYSQIKEKLKTLQKRKVRHHNADQE